MAGMSLWDFSGWFIRRLTDPAWVSGNTCSWSPQPPWKKSSYSVVETSWQALRPHGGKKTVPVFKSSLLKCQTYEWRNHFGRSFPSPCVMEKTQGNPRKPNSLDIWPHHLEVETSHPMVLFPRSWYIQLWIKWLYFMPLNLGVVWHPAIDN